ncbi:hypothetical protein JB92DRAFT_2837633 [Gautieria morchelliformis]|nr:hypothetical protein JB92DRAFT_2837633 [Gautieria morchelliformis]
MVMHSLQKALLPCTPERGCRHQFGRGTGGEEDIIVAAGRGGLGAADGRGRGKVHVGGCDVGHVARPCTALGHVECDEVWSKGLVGEACVNARDAPGDDLVKAEGDDLGDANAAIYELGKAWLICKGIFWRLFNPQTVPLLQHCPVKTSVQVTETWEATRWRELLLDLLTPMYLKDYYVNELAEMVNGELVIPVTWIVCNGGMCADARPVTLTEAGLEAHDVITNITAKELAYNYLDLTLDGNLPFPYKSPAQCAGVAVQFQISFLCPHGWTMSAETQPQLINVHKNVYLAHTNVPGRLLQQEYFVHFVSTSLEAPTPEQFEAVWGVIDFSHGIISSNLIQNTVLRYIKYSTIKQGHEKSECKRDTAKNNLAKHLKV